MKRALLITFSFPPQIGPGTIRPAKQKKYLAEFGWQTHVLTVDCNLKNPPIEADISRAKLKSLWGIRKMQLVTDIPQTDSSGSTSSLPRYRTRAIGKKLLEWSGWSGVTSFHYPDLENGWYPDALKIGRDLLRHERFDAILSSFPPVACHRLASQLSRESGIPWIADYRDEWSTEQYWMPRKGIWKFIDSQIEKRSIRHASELVTVSEAIAKNLRELHHLPVTVIPNGFDPGDYPAASPKRDTKFRLTFTGTLSTKSFVAPLLDAVDRMSKEKFIENKNFELLFVGAVPNDFAEQLERPELRNLIRTVGWVDYAKSLQYQVDASALFFPSWRSAGSEGVLSSKIFTYLGSKRPVLFIGGHEHVLAALLQRTGVGETGETTDQCRRILRDWISEWRATGSIQLKRNTDEVNAFSRRAQAEKLSGILDRCSN